MRIISLIILSASLFGCMTLEYDILYSQVHITPSMSPDGKKTFVVNAHNHLPSFEKQKSIKEFHASLIPYEMGKINYCTNGYEVDYENPKIVSDFVIYNGVCK